MQRLLLSILMVFGVAGLVACGGDSGADAAQDPGGDTGGAQQSQDNQSASSASSEANDDGQQNPPVQTPPPNAEHQEPAFPEQTRAPELDSGVEPQVEEIAKGLSHPWALALLPDGQMLVTERTGDLLVINQNGQTSEPIENVPDVDAQGQGGLLDVALAPDFASSRMIFLSYAEPREEGNGTSVARARLSDDRRRLENVEVIFRQMPPWESNQHFGSRLIWDEQGNLFITLGDRSKPEPRKLAQDLSTHIGKVVRVKPDGAAPEDNPFVDDADARDEIWSYGHRNIQGAALHPETGRLWTIEHGPRGGDEINIPEPGKNYGWPVITYGEDYSGAPIGEGETKQEGMEQPVYYWDPVIAPAGMLFYQGDMFEEWQGDLLISSLNPGALVRIEYDGNRVTGEERLLKDVGRVRDIAEGPDGALWLVTDHSDGRLLKVTK